MSKILISISPDAQRVHVDAKGFTGGSCLNATQGYENAFAGEGERELKTEFSETDQEVVFQNEEERQLA